jgi:hypothetical protein
MPTVLIYLIMIYDNEEGSKALQRTPVPITQEKVSRETSSPVSNDVTPNPQGVDLVSRSTLDIVFLDPLGR